MTTATATAADLTLPRFGTGPAAEGRKAALRSFHAHFNSLDANIFDDIAKVEGGTAPQAFKDAFGETLRDLCTLFDSTGK